MLKTRERTMFPKLNMTGDTKAEKWDHSSETLFETHHNQGNNRDEYEVGALFVHEEEEKQNKHNQKPEERSNQEFNHKEAQMVNYCV